MLTGEPSTTSLIEPRLDNAEAESAAGRGSGAGCTADSLLSETSLRATPRESAGCAALSSGPTAEGTACGVTS